jgi:glycosyltransferase involved in cell wall biosynthesis
MLAFKEQRMSHPANNNRVGKMPTRAIHDIELAVGSSAPAQWPAISVCMIVRDEAANLADCLASLRDLAREVIVVDTGSRDETVAIARSLGAQVRHFAWIDDFAAARNESLRDATGDWIFWLDADDRLSETAVAQIKNAAASGRADAYALTYVTRMAQGSCQVVEHIQLFRNGLGIRFARSIHETIWPDLARLGLRLAHTDITVTHTGYLSPDDVLRKSQRNLRLIDSELVRQPANADLIF